MWTALWLFGLGCGAEPESWERVEAGRHSACAIDPDKRLWCWGEALDYGEGPPGGKGWVEVALGAAHGCALDEAGFATCWGEDQAGETEPPLVALEGLQAGLEQTCGLERDDGTLSCWGRELEIDRSGSFAAVAMVQDRGCALSAAGEPRCWGGLVPLSSRYTAIGAGCGVLADGSVECFSSGLYSLGGSYVEVEVGDDRVCATTQEGGVECWSANLELSEVPGTVAQLSCGVGLCAALSEAGQLELWGRSSALAQMPQ